MLLATVNAEGNWTLYLRTLHLLDISSLTGHFAYTPWTLLLRNSYVVISNFFHALLNNMIELMDTSPTPHCYFAYAIDLFDRRRVTYALDAYSHCYTRPDDSIGLRHIPMLQTHPCSCPSLGMMSSQHRRRQSAYVSTTHWFSTPPQYKASPMAQHSPHKYVELRQCGPNPRIQLRSSEKPYLAGSGTSNTLLIDLPHDVCHASSLSHLT